ncbi:cell division protein FtsQ/DivIB [Marinilactibacillus sp. XAAS-LB27]|uniref:cell division protein FtsQ/DivIB n=1 Tax=Marinilactibacillus sp. XAAS-LB27 TaxID=3114538 RepID=UPI002E16EB4E|nr:cell division protein FtsQ/DivIB [Marinilactibacillus sp. XAAS-LB27]
MSKKTDHLVTNIEDIYNKKYADSPQNKKSKWSRLKAKWFGLVLFFSLTLFIGIYFLTPYSQVGAIVVEGTDEVLDQEVINESKIRSGDSLWQTYFNKSEIEKEIKATLPQVKSMELTIKDFHDVHFDISEYETVAYLYKEDTYFKILDNEKVLREPYSNNVGNLPTFFNFVDEDVLQQMLSEYNQLEQSIQSMISEVEWIENERNPLLVKAYMNNGNEVLASIPSFSERLKRYPQLVRAVKGENGLFDLEAGAYFLPFSSVEDQEYDEENSVELDNEIVE